MSKPWTAYIIHADLLTLVKVWHGLRDLFASWKEKSLPFSYNGYGEGLHPHLSIRVPEGRGDLLVALETLEKSGLAFSLSTQDYDEKEDIRWAYVLGSWLATEARRLGPPAPGKTMPMGHLVHGFVNSLGFFHASQEMKLYTDLMQMLDRTLKKAEKEGK